MEFLDRVVVSGTRRRAEDGALVTDARIARTGVQLYRGSEVDPENKQGFRDKVVRVYRPGSEVFSADTLASAAHRPVTNDHPTEKVLDASNWRKYAVGHTADEVTAEGAYIRVPLMVSDGAAIAEIENGKRELSSGYKSEIDWTSGVNDSGEAYDAIQRNIRFNHVAIVHRGRAGSTVRIGDEAVPWGHNPILDSGDEGDKPMTTPLKTVTVDGLSIEVTDQGAQVIGKLQATIDSLNAASAQVLADHATALAEADKKLALKDAEIDDLKKKVITDAEIDQRVAERSKLVDAARIVHKDLKPDGLSDADIRKTVVVAVLGDKAIEGKSQVYIDARFDVLVEESGKKKDDFRETMRTGQATVANDEDPVEKARSQYLADTLDAWKAPEAKAS